MTFFCDFFLKGKKKTTKQTTKPASAPQGLKIRCLIKTKKQSSTTTTKNICFITSHWKLAEGIGKPALTINPGVHFSKKPGCGSSQSIKGEMSCCCCVALARRSTCYLAKQWTQLHLQRKPRQWWAWRVCRPVPPLQQPFLPLGRWELALVPLSRAESPGRAGRRAGRALLP